MTRVNLTNKFLSNARGLILADSASAIWAFNKSTNTLTLTAGGGATGFANPTAKVGLAAVNGAATTAMRSDAAPPLDQAIAPTWTAVHTFGTGIKATFLTASEPVVTDGSRNLASVTYAAFKASLAIAYTDVSGLATVAHTGAYSDLSGAPSIPAAANPTASVGLATVNGSAATFMRSDGAPALSQAIAPTWTGQHTYTPGSGIAVTINCVATTQGLRVVGSNSNVSNAFVAAFVGGSAAGFSSGVSIQAGTNASDFAFRINNQANTANYLQVFGDGHGTLGNTSTSGIQWSASGAFNFSNNFLGNAANSALGYAAGAGGAVTQLTSRSTSVTLNKITGAITLFAAAGTTAYTTFTVSNSTVAATDTVVVSVKSGTNVYLAYVTAVAAGSFNITFNTTGGTASDSPVFNFAVIKAAAS
jgi:hypothetical protein